MSCTSISRLLAWCICLEFLWPQYSSGSSAAQSLDIASLIALRNERAANNFVAALASAQSAGGGRAAYALAWAELRCMRSSRPVDDALRSNDVTMNAFGLVDSRNGSSLCDQRAGLEELGGYLARRYANSGLDNADSLEL